MPRSLPTRTQRVMTVCIILAQLYAIPNPCMYVGGFLAAPHPDYELLVTFPCVGESTFFSNVITERLSMGSNRGSYTHAHIIM